MCYIVIAHIKAYFFCRKLCCMEMNKTKILVVKDCADYCTELIGLLKDSGYFEVLPPVHDPGFVVDNIKENKPELVLLNATMAGSDGIEILSTIRNCPETKDTKVVVITPTLCNNLMNIYQALGVAFIIHSSNPPAMVYHRILDLTMDDEASRLMREEQRKNEYAIMAENMTNNFFRAIGIPVNLVGYVQLRKSILYCVENSLYQINLSQDVYQYVAECFMTTPKRVERNIRTAIEAAWSRGNMEAQHRYFGNTVSLSNGRPTNKEFIANITDRIVTHLRHS